MGGSTGCNDNPPSWGLFSSPHISPDDDSSARGVGDHYHADGSPVTPGAQQPGHCRQDDLIHRLDQILMLLKTHQCVLLLRGFGPDPWVQDSCPYYDLPSFILSPTPHLCSSCPAERRTSPKVFLSPFLRLAVPSA